MSRRLTGVILLAIAAGLAWYGYDSSQALASKLSQVLTGGPTDRVLMFYAGAAVSALLGVVQLSR